VVLVNQILRSTLEKGWPGRIQFYNEALDNHRIPEEKYEQEMVKLLQRKYEGEQIDLIFTLGSAALKFLLKHQDEIFSNTPKIFVNTNEHEVDGLELGQNVTGVQGRIELRPALDLALSLHPGTRRVVVVTGNAPIDKFWEALAHREFQSYENSVEFTYLTNLTIEELRRELASQPPNTIVFFLNFLLDRAGNGYSLPESVSLVAPTSSAPIYVTIQSGFRQGVVGGRMISYEALGRTAAELGARVLAGERPQDIPPQTVPSVAMFDWRELRRWGISEAKLPPGSIVQFRELSVWEQYKWHIIGIISLCILEALLIVYLLFTRARRRRAEQESVRFALLAKAEHQHLDEVVSNVPGIVWESRLEPGTTTRRIEFVNDYIEQMLGYSVEECKARPDFWLTVIHEEDREQSARIVAAILAGGKGGIQRFRCLTKDGRTLWVEAHLITICDETGKAVGLRGVAMDITGRKLAEEDLQQALTEVSQLKNQLEEENIYLQEEIKLEHNFTEIVGHSDALKYVLFKIEQVAHTDTTVLITGETGTGKELVARAIHSESWRKDRPLVKVNCAALSASLIESELFGHEKGSFTGASARKIGRFELATGATIFLDEIGELPLELQSKLLRVIQEGEFERLGSSKTIKADVRIIAATNRNLQVEVQKGLFREDLWYRLNVFPITVPPLKQRREDVPQLVEHYVRRFSKKLGKEITSISPATLNTLRDYAWPGNIRELANVIERAVINTQGEVLRIVDHFEAVQAEELESSKKTLEEMEREHITRTLSDTGWRIEGPNGAAKVLGLNPSTLRTRMAKLGIQKPKRSLV
jgi:PAS domain S-box-containing protein